MCVGNIMLLFFILQVWDIRTFHLLRTVPQLDQCQVLFNKTGDVIFGVSLEQEMEDDTKYETAFKTFDAGDYSLIATIETKKSVLNLCPSWDDCSLAVIEQVRYGIDNVGVAVACNIILELLTKYRRSCTITEKAPTRAFSWLKAATTAFTFKTLLRHYAKRVLTPQ